MNTTRFIALAIAMLALASLLLSACAPAPTATPIPTPVPPATAQMPTAVPQPTQAPASSSSSSAAVSSSSSAAATQSVSLTLAKTSLGNVLADANGKMLYAFTKDTKDTSTCADTCATNWPPLLADKADVQTGVDAKLIGYTKRADGKSQVTYNGMPLYYFAKDAKPGDMNGQGVATSWYVVTADGRMIKPASLSIAKTSLGNVLADGDGRVLYIYTKDTTNPSASNCYDTCASFWPVMYSDGKTPTLKDGVDAKMVGTTTRKDNTMQMTYNGWPIYYWRNDKNPGDTNGQGVTGNWWVIQADGTALTVAPNPAVTIQLGAGRDGDQSGTATLTANGNQTTVLLNIKPGTAGTAQPAHIHVGTCPVPDAVKYPLNNVVDGKSTTTLDVPLAQLLTGGFAINVHLSAADIGKYVACGVIPQGNLITMGAGRDGSQPGAAVLTAQGSKTQVDLFIKPLAGADQPAHIHVGTCPVPGAVKYPLTDVVDGKSTTVVDAKLADLLAGGFAINAHLSKADIGKYVACGDIKTTASISAASSASSASSDSYYK